MPPIIEKIRKLLAIAERSDSEHERDTAMQQVYRLLAKHDLQLDQVRDRIADAAFVESYVHMGGQRMPPEIRVAGILVRDFFFVRVVFHRNSCGMLRVKVFGLAHHVAIARYVCHFLRRTFADKWRRRVQQQGHRQGHEEYVAGLGAAVQEMLRRERQLCESQGLVYRGPDLDAALSRRGVGAGDERALKASEDGYRDGQDIRIRKPLRDHSQSHPLLTGEG